MNFCHIFCAMGVFFRALPISVDIRVNMATLGEKDLIWYQMWLDI